MLLINRTLHDSFAVHELLVQHITLKFRRGLQRAQKEVGLTGKEMRPTCACGASSVLEIDMVRSGASNADLEALRIKLWQERTTKRVKELADQWLLLAKRAHVVGKARARGVVMDVDGGWSPR